LEDFSFKFEVGLPQGTKRDAKRERGWEVGFFARPFLFAAKESGWGAGIAGSHPAGFGKGEGLPVTVPPEFTDHIVRLG
jgi:hypothetical protein